MPDKPPKASLSFDPADEWLTTLPLGRNPVRLSGDDAFDRAWASYWLHLNRGAQIELSRNEERLRARLVELQAAGVGLDQVLEVGIDAEIGHFDICCKWVVQVVQDDSGFVMFESWMKESAQLSYQKVAGFTVDHPLLLSRMALQLKQCIAKRKADGLERVQSFSAEITAASASNTAPSEKLERKRGRPPRVAINGAKLTRLREEAGMTQWELSKACELSQDTVQRAEAGDISSPSLSAICQALTEKLERPIETTDLQSASRPN